MILRSEASASDLSSNYLTMGLYTAHGLVATQFNRVVLFNHHVVHILREMCDNTSHTTTWCTFYERCVTTHLTPPPSWWWISPPTRCISVWRTILVRHHVWWYFTPPHAVWWYFTPPHAVWWYFTPPHAVWGYGQQHLATHLLMHNSCGFVGICR